MARIDVKRKSRWPLYLASASAVVMAVVIGKNYTYYRDVANPSMTMHTNAAGVAYFGTGHSTDISRKNSFNACARELGSVCTELMSVKAGTDFCISYSADYLRTGPYNRTIPYAVHKPGETSSLAARKNECAYKSPLDTEGQRDACTLDYIFTVCNRSDLSAKAKAVQDDDAVLTVALRQRVRAAAEGRKTPITPQTLTDMRAGALNNVGEYARAAARDQNILGYLSGEFYTVNERSRPYANLYQNPTANGPKIGEIEYLSCVAAALPVKNHGHFIRIVGFDAAGGKHEGYMHKADLSRAAPSFNVRHCPMRMKP